MNEKNICPCQKLAATPKTYEACCQRFHLGQSPDTCEQLMRSRFSAFALNLTAYLLESWHPSTRPTELSPMNDHWLKLDIIHSESNTVHFKAYFKEDNPSEKQRYGCLEEVSRFSHDQGRWQYVDGDASFSEYKPSRNDVCLCGSGKKFKKCCAV